MGRGETDQTVGARRPPEHPRAAEGYAYGEPADIIGGKVMNADVDGVYVEAHGRKFVIALNGQDYPIVEYGRG